MLGSILILSLPIVGVFAQATPPSSTIPTSITQVHAYSFAPSCTSISYQNTRGASFAFTDRDPNFTYINQNCTSTSQKIIPGSWTSACDDAIRMVCGASPSISNINNWSWAWFNRNGATCQVGLFQPVAPQSLSSSNVIVPEGTPPDCCIASFQFVLNTTSRALLETARTGTSSDTWPNRGSINIAEGGYPYAITQSDKSQVLNNGAQVEAGRPSFIIQG